jgi:hypothetical protein
VEHPDDRCQVIDAIGTSDGGIETGPADDVGGLEAEMRIGGEGRDVCGGAGAQIIDRDHAIAALQVISGEVTTDETGTPGNQDVHHALAASEVFLR